MARKSKYRIEVDAMGKMRIPLDAYYGAQTARAVQNFPISGLRFQRGFIRAIGVVKVAACRANKRLNLLDKRKAKAIEEVAWDVVQSRFDDQFVVDIFQTGSGTSMNMNANEIIANRASELLGGGRGGSKMVHPIDDVNMCQSSNDVFPTAIHIAAAESIEHNLLPALQRLQHTLQKKSEEYRDAVKPGRTHLQDATPITLGQELSGFASMVEHGVERMGRVKFSLLELPLGGTAIGTGLNAHPKFAELAIEEISKITNLQFHRARNTFEAIKAKDAVVDVSGALKTVAGSLLKMGNDLRLLASGPFTGLGEIELPVVQLGSSIMPGKVNPVIPEAVNLVAVQVFGNDLTISLAAQLGELELNLGMPLIAYTLIQSIDLLSNGSNLLAEKCIVDIKADRVRMRRLAEDSPALITALAPIIGYEKAASIAKKVLSKSMPLKKALAQECVLTKEKFDEVIDVARLSQGGRMLQDK